MAMMINFTALDCINAAWMTSNQTFSQGPITPDATLKNASLAKPLFSYDTDGTAFHARHLNAARCIS